MASTTSSFSSTNLPIKAIGTNPIAMNAKTLLPHPYPKRSYRGLALNGIKVEQIERMMVHAPVALAA
ncbi:hypothetical protein BOTCAL_0026g00320 [Botryotinia calthae]|uniref:Uncharacterized protein n=1 Tax=Botryotinia calthae TaxID=38488 RepID=A0A4Y8DEA1_9HELO|nr:hypothetical protein BOTCAL_0026g00320 [Botryotinia calthae]